MWAASRGVSERLVELLDPQEGDTVLDLAAGTGDTGFLAASRIGASGLLLCTDAAPEMLAAAQRRGAELGITNARYRVVDAVAVDLPDASVDGVLCRWGIMLVPDCAAVAREIARLLRPSRRMALAVWAEPERNEWMTAAGRAALSLGLIEPPEPDAPGPFRLADPTKLRGLLENEGLRVTALEELEISWQAPSLDEAWALMLDISSLLRRLARSASPAEIEAVRAGMGERLQEHVATDGSVTVPGVTRIALVEKSGENGEGRT